MNVKRLKWLPLILLGLCALGGVAGLCHTFFMRAAYIVVFFMLIPQGIYLLFKWLIGKLPGHLPAKTIALALAMIPIILFVYGQYIGFYKLTIREEVFESEKLPSSFDGYRIVQLSDLHLGSYGNDTSFIKRVVDSVNALKPNVVVFTGDLVNTKVEEAEPFLNTLRQIQAPVYSITGNHDYGFLGTNAGTMLVKQLELQTRIGWKLLINESVTLKNAQDSIFLAGVEHTGMSFHGSRGDFAKAMDGIRAEDFCILLSHDPKHWRKEVLSDGRADLTLSGHTHAMQIKIFGLSPAGIIFRDWGGKYQEGKQMLNVSVGIGGIAPFRIGAWPEICVITLKKAEGLF